jgi:DNA polymerase-2
MTQQLNAFLITRHWADRIIDNEEQLVLTFWFTSDKGPVRIDITGQYAVFFIPISKRTKVTQLLASELRSGSLQIKPIKLRTFEQEKVFACYFRTQKALYQARSLLREHGINPLEADIQPTDRFLMERFIRGAVSIHGTFHTEAKFLHSVNPQIKPASFQPQYRIASLDIETSMTEDKLYSIGLLISDSHQPNQSIEKVFMLNPNANTEPHFNKADYLEFVETERELLIKLIQFFEQNDPDIIIGWNVINFDLRYLQRKAEQLNVPLRIGRDKKDIEWRQSRDNAEHFTLTIPGRLVLDGIDTLRSATYNFESFALDFVANKLLKRGKQIHSDKNRGLEITRLFEADKQALAAYNIEDCRLVWDIFQQTQLIQFAIERAQLTGLAMDRFGGSVASFDNRYLPLLHRKGYVAPNIPVRAEHVGSPGGYVMESAPGIYSHVLVLDFKSLYPSIIRTFKVDPYGLIEGNKLEPHEAIKNQKETPVEALNQLIPGFNGAVFHKYNNILPELIAELWQARDKAKSENNSAMSQAIKILMNSFYGVLGTPGCRFFDFRLPSSITLRGHQILYSTKDYIESKGFEVIYGDTDSVFVWLKGYHPNIAQESIRGIGQQLANELNQWWKQKLLQDYQIESYLELEFETHFKRFVMPTIRGSDKGSKKRYAGIKLNPHGEEQLIFKGLENVRTDWTPAARDFQLELYRRIFYNEPYHDFIRDTVARIYSGELDQQLIYRKRLRRQLSDYKKNIPPHVQAARLACKQMEQEGLPINIQRGSWIEYVLTIHGPEPLGYSSAPLDYDSYITRQIKPVADGILHFLNESFDTICNRQINLF